MMDKTILAEVMFTHIRGTNMIELSFRVDDDSAVQKVIMVEGVWTRLLGEDEDEE